MTAVFATRRRAEEFAALVDDPRGAAPTAAQRELLDLVGALRATPAAEPRPAFASDLRARLMAEAGTALAPAPGATRAPSPETTRLTLPPAQRRRDRRLAAGLAGLALVGATTSVAVASGGALPGDSLYPVKRAIEDVRTGLSGSDADRGEVLLASASDRLFEVAALSRGDDVPDPQVVAGTVVSFTEQAGDASDLLLSDYARTGRQSSVSRLRDFDAASLRRLAELEPLVPAAARDELMDAARVLFEIDARARQACPSCGGAGIREIPGVFAPVSAGTAPVAVTSPTLRPRTADPAGTRAGGDGGAAGTSGERGPRLPTGALPPGSVTGTGDGSGTGGDDAPTDDPVRTLAETLTGGGASLPTSAPEDPLVEETQQAVEEATKSVQDGLRGTVEDVTGDVTDPLQP